MNDFGKRLKSYREKKGFQIVELAKLIDVSPSTYREWENGRNIIGQPYVALASALELSISELMTGEIPKIEKDLRGIEEHIKNIRKFS
jgi:transcriptional regulator with XRE-family HTH domain